MPPLVAVTTYPAGDDGRVGVPAEYVDSVRRAGGRVVLVPPGEPDADRLLDVVDGLLLSGGGDIDPVVWGGPHHDTVYLTDAARDQTDLDLVRGAIGRGIPTFAICRGLQVLNVALGGTLHVHLPDVVGTVEAVELHGHPWLVAVQWHPELTAATDPTQAALFDGFVAAAAQRQLVAT